MVCYWLVMRPVLKCEYKNRAIAHILYLRTYRQNDSTAKPTVMDLRSLLAFQNAFQKEKVMTSKIMNPRAKYGIDAPGVVGAHIVVGSLLALIATIGLAWPKPNPAPLSLSVGAASLAVLFLFAAAVMLRSSLVSKRRVRDRLVAALALSGDECVLDAGCGRGLALIGCAKELTTGKAIGIDLWAGKDLSNNNPEATRANAAAEGVADRVEVETGDITRLPFSDALFDVVVSMTGILRGFRFPMHRSTWSSR
jgi:hypothetical protein